MTDATDQWHVTETKVNLDALDKTKKYSVQLTAPLNYYSNNAVRYVSDGDNTAYLLKYCDNCGYTDSEEKRCWYLVHLRPYRGTMYPVRSHWLTNLRIAAELGKETTEVTL